MQQPLMPSELRRQIGIVKSLLLASSHLLFFLQWGISDSEATSGVPGEVKQYRFREESAGVRHRVKEHEGNIPTRCC